MHEHNRHMTFRFGAVATAIASIAALGGGIATAVAEWSDAVHIAGGLSSLSLGIDIQVDAGDWASTTAAIPVADFSPLGAPAPDPTLGDPGGGPFTTTWNRITVRNSGTATAELAVSLSTEGALFSGDESRRLHVAVVTEHGSDATCSWPASLAASATATCWLRVSMPVPAWTGIEHQDESGSITVSAVGTVA